MLYRLQLLGESDNAARENNDAAAAPEDNTAAAPEDNTAAAPEDHTAAASEDHTSAASEDHTSAASEDNSAGGGDDETAAADVAGSGGDCSEKANLNAMKDGTNWSDENCDAWVDLDHRRCQAAIHAAITNML